MTQPHSPEAKWTQTPWTCGPWSTTGPSAATAFVISKSFQERGRFYCQACEAGKDPGLSVFVAVGESQEVADANGQRICAAVNACQSIPGDPEKALTKAIGLLLTIRSRAESEMFEDEFNALCATDALKSLGYDGDSK